MQRCLELAQKGAGYVAPNPMVGALLVHDGVIIGEGYHQQYGKDHAEVNCIRSVSAEEKEKIKKSSLYVSLEPCAHFGKTPPCAELIITNQIPQVIIGCRDPFKEVNGKGIEILKDAGITVIEGILEKECKGLNKRFFTFQIQHRPYIILKWAETADGLISGLLQPPPDEKANAASLNQRTLISNEQTNRLTHKWRSEEAAILVGTNTALMDDPELTTRNWPGPSPVRLVIDMDLSLPASLKIFNGGQKTVVFNSVKHDANGNLNFYQVTEDVSLVHQIVNALYQLKIQSVIVEGGARLLQSFIDEGMWDEARIIKNEKLIMNDGLAAPQLSMQNSKHSIKILNDSVGFYFNEANTTGDK